MPLLTALYRKAKSNDFMLLSAITVGQRSVVRYRIGRGLLACAFVLALSCLAARQTVAQESSATSAWTASPQAQTDNPSTAASEDQPEASTRSGTSSPMGAPSLSADQIISILEQNPSLAEELKTRLADELQFQGTEVAPGDISDQMLDTQIASSARVREDVTTYLQAQGYLESTEPGLANKNALNTSLPGEQSFNRSNMPEHTGMNRGRGSAQPDHQRNSRVAEQANASTDLPRVIHQRPPYDLQSLRDLYTQIPDSAVPLTRFGSDVFVNRNPAVAREAFGRSTPLDVPLGPDYIVGPGDTLTINLWGGLTRTIIRTIGRDGRIFLPDAGSIQLAGLSLGKAQSLIESALKQQYRNAQVAVTISDLRSV